MYYIRIFCYWLIIHMTAPIDVKKNRLIMAFACAYPLLDLHKIIRRMRITHLTVQHIIGEEGLRPYKIHHVQALQPNDYTTQRSFCRCMLHKLQRDAHFLERVFWSVSFTDESSISSCRHPQSTKCQDLDLQKCTCNSWKI